MTTVNLTGNAVGLGYPANTSLIIDRWLKQQIDCGNAGFNRGSGDIDQVFTLNEGYLVEEVICEVLTEEGATATMDVGITGGDVDAWLDGVDLNSAGWSRSSFAYTSLYTTSTTNANMVAAGPTQVYGVIGKYLHTSSTADTMDVLYNNASIDACKFNLYAHIIDLKLLAPPR